MFVPIHTDRPLRHTPAVNIGLIAVNLVMFALQHRFPALESTLLLRPREPTLVGFLGSAFLHADVWHIGFNMLFLYIFGNSVNDKLGNVSYLGFYLGGAIAAGLLHVLLQDAPVLGASGAVMAVTGAYLALFPQSRVVVLILLFVITTAYVPALLFIGIYFALDVIGAFSGILGDDGGNRVANFAHIGGTFYGVGVAFLLMATNLVPRDQMDLLAVLRRWRLRRQHAAGLRAMGQSHLTAHDIVPATPDAPRLARVQALRDGINSAFDEDDLRQAARLYAKLLATDAGQVLTMQRQLDVANQLASDGNHSGAAAAYELFLDRYQRHEDHARTQLMLGLIYGRYLAQPDAARRHLEAVRDRLPNPDQADLARRELDALPA